MARAMVLAQNTLFVAGPPDILTSDGPIGALEGVGGGTLIVLSGSDGEQLAEYELDAPPVFVSREVEALVRGLAYELQEQGFTLDGYLNTTDRTAEDLLAEFQPTAEKRVRKALILAKLVEEEEIEVDDSEIEDEVTRMTHAYGQDRQVLRDALLDNEQVREDMRDKLYGRKVVQRLAQTTSAVDSGSAELSAEEPSPEAGGEQDPAEPDPSD